MTDAFTDALVETEIGTRLDQLGELLVDVRRTRNETDMGLRRRIQAELRRLRDMDLKLTDEEREHIKQRRAEQKAKAWMPRALESYALDEKEQVFDKLHKLALDHYLATRRRGYGTKDFGHWCADAVLGLLGPGAWDALAAAEEAGGEGE